MKRLQAHWGSHLPILIKAMQITNGDVVECGCGYFSTPCLHWMCMDSNRILTTYEGDEWWCNMFSRFNNGKHLIQHITNWDSINFSIPIGLAFIDHQPDERRWKEVQRLLHVDLLVLHDAGGNDGIRCGYDKLKGLFNYTWISRKEKPYTAVLSNKLNCRKLFS